MAGPEQFVITEFDCNYNCLLFARMSVHIPHLIKICFNFRAENCDAFQCTIEVRYEEMCVTFFKGKDDENCFIPCQLANCSKTYEEMTLCNHFTCNPKMVPILPAFPVSSPGMIAAISSGSILLFICIILGIYLAKTKRLLNQFRLGNESSPTNTEAHSHRSVTGTVNIRTFIKNFDH
jgi:hypothetical protein